MSRSESPAPNSAAAPPVARESLQSLLDQLTLARAAELARAGHYVEAEEVLSAGKDETGHGPKTLDLLARIHAQQGRLAEAEKLWTRASLLDPANPAYALALRRAGSPRRGARRFIIMPTLAACVTLCAVIGVLWWRNPQRVRDAQLDTGHSTQAGSSSTPGQPSAPPRPSPAAVPALEPAPRAPVENSIDVRGVTVTEGPDGLTLSFDEGLFRSGLTLRPDARVRLKELSRQLKPYAGNYAVRITGMTDDLPLRRGSRHRDNVSLGMDRARFVYDYLRFDSGLDSQHLTISSGGRHPPGRNDGADNRAGRRTVVLHIGVR